MKYGKNEKKTYQSATRKSNDTLSLTSNWVKILQKIMTSGSQTHHYCTSINHVLVCSLKGLSMNCIDICSTEWTEKLACDIHNAYLTVKLVWTTAGPFGLEEGSIMVIKMALYGLTLPSSKPKGPSVVNTSFAVK